MAPSTPPALTRPDFVVVGAPRSGTTSLHYYLDQHPGIAMSAIKEPNFFLFDGPGDRDAPLVAEPRIVAKSVSDPAEYERLFADATPGQVTGDISVLYLYAARTPELIARCRPDARIAMVLRHPVDRAYSHFLYTYTGPAEEVRAAFRTAALEELGEPETPFVSGTHLLRLSDYGPQLDRYLAQFPREQVLVGIYDDLQEDPAGFLRTFCEFVGVDPGFAFDTGVTYNGSSVGSRTRRAVAQAAGKVAPTVKKALPTSVAGKVGHIRARFRRKGEAPPLGDDFRRELAAHFEPSIRRVEELTERDLPGWRA